MAYSASKLGKILFRAWNWPSRKNTKRTKKTRANQLESFCSLFNLFNKNVTSMSTIFWNKKPISELLLKENLFSYKRFCTWPRFKREAKSNSEMGHFISWTLQISGGVYYLNNGMSLNICSFQKQPKISALPFFDSNTRAEREGKLTFQATWKTYKSLSVKIIKHIKPFTAIFFSLFLHTLFFKRNISYSQIPSNGTWHLEMASSFSC